MKVEKKLKKVEQWESQGRIFLEPIYEDVLVKDKNVFLVIWIELRYYIIGIFLCALYFLVDEYCPPVWGSLIVGILAGLSSKYLIASFSKK